MEYHSALARVGNGWNYSPKKYWEGLLFQGWKQQWCLHFLTLEWRFACYWGISPLSKICFDYIDASSKKMYIFACLRFTTTLFWSFLNMRRSSLLPIWWAFLKYRFLFLISWMISFFSQGKFFLFGSTDLEMHCSMMLRKVVLKCDQLIWMLGGSSISYKIKSTPEINSFNPLVIVSIFELAMVQSSTMSIPNLYYCGCYNHFIQAVWRKVCSGIQCS